MTWRGVLWRYLALAGPLLLVIGVLHVLDLRTVREQWRVGMANNVANAMQSLTAGFHEAAADTLVLANDRGLARRLKAARPGVEAQRFEAMARFKPHYRQIRFIDARGMEQVRVDVTADGRVVTATEQELQDKSTRDYFVEAVGLSRGGGAALATRSEHRTRQNRNAPESHAAVFFAGI